MNMTRKPVTRVHTKLTAIWFWPTMLTKSGSVNPTLGSPTTMSLTVPVMVPPGSPFARCSAFGPAIAFRSTSVIATGAAAAGAAAAGCAGAGAGAWARAAPAPSRDAVIVNVSSVVFIVLSPPSPLPHGLLLISLVERSHDSSQAYDDAYEYQDQPARSAASQPQASECDQKPNESHSKSDKGHCFLLVSRRGPTSQRCACSSGL